MNLQNYKTKSACIMREMPKVNGNNQYANKLIIGIDGGYSSVKVVTADKAIMFPSYAKHLDRELESVIKNVDSFNYQLRFNNTGDIWAVGALAESMLDSIDLEGTTDDSVYGRYHYRSEMFKAQMTLGLGLALRGKEIPSEIIVQTGLPVAYKDRDEKVLREALAGDYDFSIRVGSASWEDFRFTLSEENVFVTSQPKGTMSGIAYGTGDINGKDFLSSNAIIYDLGFGTEDSFAIAAGFNAPQRHTYTDTAMKSAIQLAIQYITRDYPAVDVKVFEMQNYLMSGQIPFYDEIEGSYEYIDIEPYFERAENELLAKSIDRLMNDYEKLMKYKYLVVTGGTGEARFERIKNILMNEKKIVNLHVIPGNCGDPNLPFAYSNAVGYYLFRQKAVTKQSMQ